MTCWSARRRSNAYLDGTLREADRSRLTAHLRQCVSCTAHVEQIQSVRTGLRELRKPSLPAKLKMDLMVLASRERQAMLETNGSRWLRHWQRWKFRLDDLMRPITLPATGGLISSLLLFATLGFTIGSTTRSVSYEVPVQYASQGDANLVPVELRSAVVLTLSLDGNGRIVDYAVRDGSASFAGNATRLQNNNISLPEFPSVLALAHPVSRDISISFTPILYRQ